MTGVENIRRWRHFILIATLPASAAFAGICPLPSGIPAAEPGTNAEVTADQAILDGSLATVTGNVRLEQAGQALTAPALEYDGAAQRVVANDGLRYRGRGIQLSAERADVRLDSGVGEFIGTDYALTTNGGRGQAASVAALGGESYRLTDTTYTTCAGDEPAWQLAADRIELDRNRGRGEAFDTVLRVGGMPLFYTPYLNFPIDDERHTGLLTPTLGHSTDDGAELALPYYINLAPNYDATITPRLLSRRGLQLGGEFRYLHAHHRGEVAAEYLPSDQRFGDDRSLLRANHEGRFGHYLGLQVDATRVSDEAYFEDLGTTLSGTSQSQLQRLLRLTLAAPGVRAAVLAQDYQPVLADTLNNRPDPFERVPAAQISLLTPNRGPQLGLDAELVRFDRNNTIPTRRTDLRPRLLWQHDALGWFARGEAAYRHTRYQPDTGPRLERDIGSASLDVGLRLRRKMDNGWLQTLEPRLFYLYTGYEDQSALPLFDTAVADLHFHRLFARNRFIGVDRIGDANQLTVGVTTRFIDPESGRDVLSLGLGRVFGFRELEVNAPVTGVIGYDDQDSDVVATAALKPTQHWESRLALQTSPGDDRINRASVRVGYDDGPARHVSLGYRYFRDLRQLPGGTTETLEQVDLRLAWQIDEQWQVINRWNYSLESHQSVEMLAGVGYRPSCCWATRVAFRRFVRDATGERASALLLQVELTGLGRFGDDIWGLLDRDIVRAGSQFTNLRYR